MSLGETIMTNTSQASTPSYLLNLSSIKQYTIPLRESNLVHLNHESFTLTNGPERMVPFT